MKSFKSIQFGLLSRVCGVAALVSFSANASATSPLGSALQSAIKLEMQKSLTSKKLAASRGESTRHLAVEEGPAAAGGTARVAAVSRAPASLGNGSALSGSNRNSPGGVIALGTNPTGDAGDSPGLGERGPGLGGSGITGPLLGTHSFGGGGGFHPTDPNGVVVMPTSGLGGLGANPTAAVDPTVKSPVRGGSIATGVTVPIVATVVPIQTTAVPIISVIPILVGPIAEVPVEVHH